VKESATWHSERLQTDVKLVRWGTYGTPVLLYPTAGGDAEEIERMLMIRVLDPLLSNERIKIYSVDSIAARAWGDTSTSAQHATKLQNDFDSFVHKEVVPTIRRDCEQDDIEIVVAGASIGAFNAMASICRHPDIFSRAICMSGSYDIQRFIKGINPAEEDSDFYHSSPMHFVPNLPDGEQLELLRKRHILMCHGGGRWEDPEQDWSMARILGAKGVPNRVDPWGTEYDHDWPTWRAMLPRYLEEV
jgi:esterase/lipase superfamily enzyme